MKVRDIFGLNNSLKSLKLLAGDDGLEKEIKDIEVCEVPDGVYWANEGDLAITTGYFIYDGKNDLVTWIEILHEKGAVGLGIKTDRFIKKVSPEALEKANQLNFPLFEIPVYLSYSDIMWPVISKIFDEKNFINFAVEKCNDELLNISSKSYSLKDVTSIMTKYIRNQFVLYAYYNNSFECMMHFKAKNSTIQLVPNIIRENKELVDSSGGFFCTNIGNIKIWISPLRTQGEIIGYFSLISHDESHTTVDMKLAKLAFPYLIVAIFLEIPWNDLTYRTKDEFIRTILYKKYINRVKLKHDAAYFNIQYNFPRIVWILEMDAKEEVEKVLEHFYEYINRDDVYDSRYILFENNKLICINKITGQVNEEKWYQGLCKEIQLKSSGSKLKIGISKVAESLDRLPVAYDEANFSLEIGEIVEEGNIHFFNNLMVYYVLYEMCRSPVLIRLYESTIKKLREHDLKNSSELVKTLSSYIENNYNVYKTAEDLFIHRNTLYKRLRKIDNILDLNMKESEKRLVLSMSLKLNNLYNNDLYGGDSYD